MSGHRAKVGEKVKIGTKKLPGTCRFIGVTAFSHGEWVGVELDEAVGKNDGSVDGKRYFQCPKACGIFVKQVQVNAWDERAAKAPAASGEPKKKKQPQKEKIINTGGLESLSSTTAGSEVSPRPESPTSPPGGRASASAAAVAEAVGLPDDQRDPLRQNRDQRSLQQQLQEGVALLGSDLFEKVRHRGNIWSRQDLGLLCFEMAHCLEQLPALLLRRSLEELRQMRQ